MFSRKRIPICCSPRSALFPTGIETAHPRPPQPKTCGFTLVLICPVLPYARGFLDCIIGRADRSTKNHASRYRAGGSSRIVESRCTAGSKQNDGKGLIQRNLQEETELCRAGLRLSVSNSDPPAALRPTPAMQPEGVPVVNSIHRPLLWPFSPGLHRQDFGQADGCRSLKQHCGSRNHPVQIRPAA